MDVSFAAFKKIFMYQGLGEWEVVKEEKNGFTLRQSSTTLEYKNIPDMADKLTNAYGYPCFVYRVRRNEDGEPFHERYKVVYAYQGEWFRFHVRVKKLNVPCPMKVHFYTMDEKWNVKNVDKIPSELLSFQTAFLEAIQELPEFRLYAVTGMLNGN